MTDHSGNIAGAARQQSIRAKCFHPTGTYVEFRKEEIEQSIPDRFEQMVRMYPDRLAVKTRTHQLTYDALNKSANRVAQAILAKRGRGEEPIALLLEHSAAMVVGILGVFKAGKFYLPLDISYPRARTMYILEDSHAGLIVTNNRNLSLGKELARNAFQLINIDELDASVSTANLGLSIPPETLSWIHYTSGSTGQPKGVVQNHRNVIHFIMNYTNGLHICTDERLTHVNRGAQDIFSALLNGASLFPLDIREEGLAHLANWLMQEKITIYHSFPTVFRHFVQTLTGDESFSKLRVICLEGEPVYKRDVELYKKHFFPSCIFVNRLGSTEIRSMLWYFIDKETQIDGDVVPVGYPVRDTEILLLGDNGERVSFNDIGEIAVKSRYLSPGYWRSPELTRAAFLPDAVGGDERIYRTGDMGRMLPDSCLLHLGRKDFQVKIRGYRIEVNEIESALLSLDTVKEAVVVVREDVSVNPSAPLRTGKRLVAYIVPTGQPAPTARVLRRVLAEKLPDYMVPSAFVILDTLPLTPNGKVDRRALPAPSRARPELDTPFTPPRIPAEEALAQIWTEVLSVDQVGIHDNFLELGGHSLLATQIISRVLNTFHVEVPMRSLLETPTVASMAVAIVQHLAGKAEAEEMAHMLAHIESLSDEEAQRLVTQAMQGKGSLNAQR